MLTSSPIDLTGLNRRQLVMIRFRLDQERAKLARFLDTRRAEDPTFRDGAALEVVAWFADVVRLFDEDLVRLCPSWGRTQPANDDDDGDPFATEPGPGIGDVPTRVLVAGLVHAAEHGHLPFQLRVQTSMRISAAEIRDELARREAGR